ncbi:MAG: glycosyltransferase family 4 protein [Vicinamibacterales bacterium]
MQIAIDARYIREKPSGIGTYVQALVERLPQLAPSERFLFWAHPLAKRPLSPAPNTHDVVVQPGPNSPLPIWWPARYVPFDGVDVFHSPHNLLPRAVPVASVVTVHDVMAIERPDLHLHGLERLAKSTYYPQGVWRALREATRIIAPTEDAARRICGLHGPARARLRVILEAADPVFRPAADPAAALSRARILTGSTDPYLLVVGANSATKRHADAVAAFVRVPPPWRLVLLQRQGADNRLARLARGSGVGDRIVWIPRVDRADVVALMQAAGALVQPSIYEGFGLPVIEAMACGCPVVCSDIPVFREVTGGRALFAPPMNVVELGAAMARAAASDALRHDLAASGLERASQLSWDRCAAETLAVYREAASVGAPGASRRAGEQPA